MYIPIILGTAREERESEKVAQFVYEELQKVDGVETELIDVKDFQSGHTVPSWEESKLFAPWREKAAKADAFLIVTPEYNRGYPGEFKIFWDSAYQEYAKKPVGIVSVSAGGFGGVRVAQNLLPVLQACSAVAINATLSVSKVEDFNGADQVKRLGGVFEELTWYARVLKEPREALPKE